MPPKPDLSFSGLEEFVNKPTVKKPVVETSKAKASAEEPKVVRKSFGPPLNEDWISDSEDEAKSNPKIKKKTFKPSFAKIKFVKSKEQVKSPMKTTIKQVVLINTTRQVSTAHPKSILNDARQMSYHSKSAHSSVKRPIHKKTTFNNNNVNQRVNIVRSKIVNTARSKAVVNAVQGNVVNIMKKLMEDMLLLEVTPREEKSLAKMDVKSDFLYGKIEEEVYVCQPPGFEDPYFHDKVNKVEKQYMDYIKLLEHVYACARYQVNPKVSHLHVVKRIFRYLKGQPKFGLWYSKDSPFDLVAYTVSNYAGASLDRKSITRGYQFLGCRLISWQCKKHTVVANSTTEVEYVVDSSCCGQVI
nr:putative ribonuclease H-like domain-containing protein [Tanacetum cinerariifolium]